MKPHPWDVAVQERDEPRPNGVVPLGRCYAAITDVRIARTRAPTRGGDHAHTVAGTRRLVPVRAGDLDAPFPGLLAAVLASWSAVPAGPAQVAVIRRCADGPSSRRLSRR